FILVYVLLYATYHSTGSSDTDQIASLVGPAGDPWDQRVRSQLIGKDLVSGLLVYELPLSSLRKKYRLSLKNDMPPRDNVNSSSTKNKRNGVHVPRQKFIAISKSELLDAIVLMFDSPKQKHDFLLMSSCLDSILHAEHKTILEEMREDYDVTHYAQPIKTSHSQQNSIPDDKDSMAIDLSDILGYATKNSEKPIDISRFGKSSSIVMICISATSLARVPVDTRFQRAFIQLLYNAQFEELSAADLMLTSALNTDYLLTLPVYVDWKKASDSRAIIFRRGYATERQNGLLIGEKLDYLQSKILQALFFGISKPLGQIGMWFAEAFKRSIEGQDVEVWIKRMKLWFMEVPLFRKSYMFDELVADDMLGVDEFSDKDLPIWLAAQKAVTRYEGILSSAGPRGRLLRKLLTWTGLVPSMPEKIFNLDSNITASEAYLRPIFLSRISLSDIWEPASRRLCENNPWKMLKSAFSIFLSRSVLQEPAFQELILLYTKETEDKESIDQAPVLQLKIYEKIPIPDLPVIFPHKKLSFRILDTVRLDIATVLGLLAYFINYKFENILSSPSAILLDVIAASALVLYASRIVLGYKQTWDRYQLLVNRTLYEKTLASGFGSVHFLLDASEQQQYKEAILAYAILLKAEGTQATFAESAQDQCERFMYDVFRKKVEMPIDKAVNTLMRLDLVIEKEVDGRVGLLPIPCCEAYTILKQRWNSFVS
ncbi:MAP protein, partial [Tanacetum coccineum]